MAANLEKDLKAALKRIATLENRVLKLERKHETTGQTIERLLKEAKAQAAKDALLAKRDALFEMRRDLMKEKKEISEKATKDALLMKRDALFEMRREIADGKKAKK